MKALILIFLLLFIIINTRSQTTSFDSLTNNILLRIQTHQTDSITKKFLQKYMPILLEKKHSWQAIPPIENAEQLHKHAYSHALFFTKHPFVDFDASGYKLDLLTTENDNTILNFKTYYITLFFESKKKALNSFEMLCKAYNKLSTSKYLKTIKGKKIAIFKNTNTEGMAQKVEFILTKDDLFDSRYKIIFGQIIDFQFEEYYNPQQ